MINDSLIQKAYTFAQTAHDGQKRLSGDPYISHLFAVANILKDWKMDAITVAAGFLHDSVEDGAATKEDIQKEFGETIFLLVDGVTKIGELKLRGSTEEEFVENLRKMFLAMAKDLRVVIIKLADRLHNMQTLEYLPVEKQQRIARETLEIYAPLADRLGMGEVKGELEDLAFPYLYPDDYKWLWDFSRTAYKEAEEHVTQIKRKLLTELIEEKIRAEINGRAKHLYSLYGKLLRPEINKDLTLIHDLVALRIVVENIDECYVALGVIHKIFKPVPALGVSDYIAVPKPNGYRSIHTRVFGPAGRIVEIQIRTYQMHEQAEMGLAAHWQYSYAKSKGDSDEKLQMGKVIVSNKLSWVKQLVDWQKEMTDSKEYLDALKFDALQHRNLVFSPIG
ncbi:MAG: HD domain-containing protein, partial [Patescibacteria group bacterium]